MHSILLWLVTLFSLAMDGLVWGIAACVLYRALRAGRPRGAASSRPWWVPAGVAALLFLLWDHWLFAQLVAAAGIARSGVLFGPGWYLEVVCQVVATLVGFRLGAPLLARVSRR
jgi:hypothetical protein